MRYGKKIKVVSAIIAAVSTMLLTGCGVVKFDPENYCDVTVSGANGYASAYVSSNYDLITDVVKNVNDKGKGSSTEQLDALGAASDVKFEIISDKKENLSNGDVLEIQVVYDKESAKENGHFTFSKEKFKYKVTGLEDAIPIDPFEGLEVTFEGISPKATVKLDNSKCDSNIRYDVYYTCDAETVANGDMITVKAEESYPGQLMNKGYALALTSKEYVVFGVTEGKNIDPFEGLELEYSGISPKINVSFNTNGCDEFVRNNVKFSTTDDTFANGEICKVKISYSESKAENNGIIFTEEEKDYTISGAPEYARDASSINFKALEDEGKNYVESKVAKNNFYMGSSVNGGYLLESKNSYDTYEITNVSFKPVKIYFASTKNSQSKKQNCCDVIWEVSITGEKTKSAYWESDRDSLEIGQSATAVYLASVYYENITLNSNGAVITDDLKMECNNLWYRCAAYSDNLSKTPEKICEGWRANDVMDWNIEILDYDAK